MPAGALSQPKGYDTNEIIAAASDMGMERVILPKSNRKEKRAYGRALYKLRRLVENGFLEQAVARDSDPLCQEGRLCNRPGPPSFPD